MDRLTTIRSFGKPGCTPARHTRIYANRWYLVTFQNTGRDQGDGYYLAEGEYTSLLPGDRAREARDAKLNHCNNITEYKGLVFEVSIKRWAQTLVSWATTADYTGIAAQLAAEWANHQARLKREMAHYEQAAAETLADARVKYPTIRAETHAEHRAAMLDGAANCQRLLTGACPFTFAISRL
jgi:hypothetical protein